MSYVQSYYHIVFSTKHRAPVLHKGQRETLFRYLWGILKNKHCHLYRINAVEDHLHLLTSIHPTLALADLIRELKTSTSAWIKKENVFPEFSGWQTKYAAFTKSHSHRDSVVEYIKNQEAHHQHEGFLDELKRLLEEDGVVYDERYLE
jgi:REP element-mobilizing transposase RayT